MLGLILVATVAAVAMVRILRNSSAAPAQRSPAHRSFFRSRGGWVLWVAICGGSFILGGILRQFWLGLALIVVGGVVAMLLELSWTGADQKRSP